MDLKVVLEKMKTQEPLEILGLTELPDKETLNRAKKKQIIKYHPDRYSGEDAEVAEEISSIINESVQTILANWDSYSFTSTESEELTQKGANYTAAIGLKYNQMLKGCEVEVTPFGHDGVEPIKITIPPNTISRSMLVFEGLGQKSKVRNGDLLVYCVAVSTTHDKEGREVAGISDTIYLDMQDKVELGFNKVSLFNKSKVEIEKVDASVHYLFVGNIAKGEKGKSALISY